MANATTVSVPEHHDLENLKNKNNEGNASEYDHAGEGLRAYDGTDGAEAGPHTDPRPGEHWQHHPGAKLVHVPIQPLSDKLSTLAAASQGDHCVQIPATDERLIVSGPYLQLLGFDSAKALWRASVLVLSPPARGTMLHAEPSLRLYDQGRTMDVQGLQLDEFSGWKFWRFDFSATLGEQPRSLEYSLSMDGVDQAHRYPVALAAAQQGWNWGFHSCNGLSAGADVRKWKDPHLWEDILTLHETAPLHALMGGGDQIYNDGLWSVPSLAAWLAIDNNEERLHHDFTQAMAFEVTEFTFNHYRVHFNARPMLARAYACIPQMSLWDDHDIWDGWGSYPDHLQNCPVFQGIYRISRRFYLMFQHHTTDELSRSMNDLFGPPGTYSFCRQLGARVALLAPDSRAQRSTKRIISPEAYAAIFARLTELPASIRHLVVVPTVPVVFPKLPLSELAMQTIDASGLIKGALQKTGLAAGILDRFHHASLLDDIVDHWDANAHRGERRSFVERLQQVAKARELRVSFISGDVHVAAVGRLYSRPKMAHLRHDPRFMPQLVSSAIWNCPPPHTLITLLERTSHAEKLNHNTQEKMVRIFKDNPTPKLMGRRNWLLVEELPLTMPNLAAQQPDTPNGQHRLTKASGGGGWAQQKKLLGALRYTLRVEDPEHQTGERRAYSIICPQFVWNPLRNHPAVRRSTFLRRCVCLGPKVVEDPLEEL